MERSTKEMPFACSKGKQRQENVIWPFDIEIFLYNDRNIFKWYKYNIFEYIWQYELRNLALN